MWPFSKKPAVVKPEETVVYARTVGCPAKFWTSTVYYDAWGAPYFYGDGYHDWMPVPMHPGGKTRTTGDVQWKHKSGPDVTFPDVTAPDKGWFPK